MWSGEHGPGGTWYDEASAFALSLCQEQLGLEQPVARHIPTYDLACERYIPSVINGARVSMFDAHTNTRHVLAFSGLHFSRATYNSNVDVAVEAKPSNCLIGGRDYTMKAQATITHYSMHSSVEEQRSLAVLPEDKKHVIHGVCLFEMPCMVGSKFCNSRVMHGDPKVTGVYDNRLGGIEGCFVLGGSVKRAEFKQALRPNTPVSRHRVKDGRPYYTVEFRSAHEGKFSTTSTTVLSLREPKGVGVPIIGIELQFVPKTIDLATAFGLLGVTTVGGIIDVVCDRGHPRHHDPRVVDATRAIAEHTMRAAGVPRRTQQDYIDVLVSQLPATYAYQGAPVEVRKQRLRAHVTDEVFPHLAGTTPSDVDGLARARCLGACVRRLLRVWLGLQPTDNRDGLNNVRVIDVGIQLTKFVRILWMPHVKRIRWNLQTLLTERKLNEHNMVQNLGSVSNKMTTQLLAGIRNGDWSAPDKRAEVLAKSGLSHNVQPVNAFGLVSELAGVGIAVNRSGSNTDARMQDGTFEGKYDPSEGPEGSACGLHNTLVNLTRIRRGQPTPRVVRAVEQLRGRFMYTPPADPPVDDGAGAPPPALSTVWVNHVPVFRTSAPSTVCTELRRMRSVAHQLHHEVSVAWVCEDEVGDVHVNSDPGEVLTPYLVVARLESLRRLMGEFRARASQLMPGERWRRLVTEGVIEYLGSMEDVVDRTTHVAMSFSHIAPSHTHLVIAPSITTLGPTSSQAVFYGHSQQARHSYRYSQAKQSMCGRTLASAAHTGALVPELDYPQEHIVVSDVHEAFKLNEQPSGQVYLVAFGSLDGFNEEDAKIMKAESVERGAGNVTIPYRFVDTEVISSNDSEQFGVPPLAECRNLPAATFDHINPLTGTPDIGTIVSSGDIIIAKYALITSLPLHYEGEERPPKRKIYRDRSTRVKRGVADATVEQVTMNVDDKGNRRIVVLVRQRRNVEVGDKFTDRHGQKGTVGRLVRSVDMPHTASGIVPDFVVNPHGMPSRMTVGVPQEMQMGKLGALAGRQVRGGAYRRYNPEWVAEEFRKHGHCWSTKEVMYDGATGRKFRHQVALGFLSMERLNHIAAHKLYARQRGPVEATTGQASNGRTNNGGIRFGEMERDAMIAHGGSETLHGRLCTENDGTEYWWCSSCGTPAAQSRDDPERGVCIHCTTVAQDDDDDSDDGTATRAQETPPVVRAMISRSMVYLRNQLSTLNMDADLFIE